MKHLVVQTSNISVAPVHNEFCTTLSITGVDALLVRELCCLQSSPLKWMQMQGWSATEITIIALQPPGPAGKATLLWVLQQPRMSKMSSSFPHSAPPSVWMQFPLSSDTGACSHLGKYTSTFCFLTELAHSLIKEALSSGSSVARGTSCLERTIIMLISSPS